MKANTSAPDEVLLQRAALLLSFAATSERVGDHRNQLERTTLARRLLNQLCAEDAPEKAECRAAFADTYVAEGNYLWRIGKPSEAAASYGLALKHRPGSGARPDQGVSLAVASGRTLAHLSRAQLSADMDGEALQTANLCRETIKPAIDRPNASREARIVEALCYLRGAQAAAESKDAQGQMDRLAELLEAAATAEKRFNDLLREDPNDVAAVEALAATLQAKGFAHSQGGRSKEAEKHITNGVELLFRVVRNNPQNDNVASLLNHLLSQQVRLYEHNGRTELAASSSEARAELAELRLGSPRSGFWRDQQLATLQKLGGLYAELGRRKDALAVTDRDVEIRRDLYSRDTQDEARLTSLALSLWQAGKHAREIPNGVVAFERYGEALDLSERRLAELASRGPRGQDDYSVFDGIAYSAIDGLSLVTASMLPSGERVAILESIVARITRHVTAEPRIVTYRHAFRRSLHQLAIAYEQAGNVAASLAAHERASRAGSRTSTVVMRRWFLEGHKAIKANSSRAQELETLANRQVELAHWDISTKSRSGTDTDTEMIYLEEPGSNVLPIADEVYRLRRFRNREISAEGDRVIKTIYELAQSNKVTVAALLKSERDRDSSSTQMPRTAVSASVKGVEDLLKAGKAEEAHRNLVDVRNRLDRDKSASGPEEHVLAWGHLGEMFHAIAKASKEGQPQLSTSSEADERAAFDRVLSVYVDGSSPRLKLAGHLELLARRASGAARNTAATALYERANKFRRLVRIDDPKNADCACLMATNFNAMSTLYAKMGADDEALQTKRAAVEIHEEQVQLLPEAGWETALASRALELAALYAKQYEPRSALIYALRAAEMRRASASDHSADLKIRIEYAAALEAVSEYAHTTARGLGSSRQRNRAGFISRPSIVSFPRTRFAKACLRPIRQTVNVAVRSRPITKR